MPTAKFDADFSSFLQAIDQAKGKLVEMSAGADTVGQRFNDMVANLSGRALLQEATMLTVAVDQIGGAAKLTASELETVGNKANEAVEKMKAMGYEVPKGLADLAKATEANVTATTDWSSAISTLQGVLGAFGIQTTINGVIAFAQSVISAGAEIQKLKDQTGLTGAEVQKLQFIAGQTGSSVEGMTTAISNLQARIGSGDTAAIGALKRFGITAEEFKNQSPLESLTKLAEGFQNITTQTDRADAARDLFGKGWQNMVPTLLADIKKLGDEAPIMADKYQKSLEQIGNDWAKLKAKIVVEGAEMIQGFKDSHERLRQVTGGMTQDEAAALVAQITGVANALKTLDQNRPKDIELVPNIKATTLSLAEEKQIADQLTKSAIDLAYATDQANKSNAAWYDVMVSTATATDDWRATLAGLSDETKAYINYELDLGVKMETLATALGLTAEQTRALTMARNEAKESAAASLALEQQWATATAAGYDAIEKKTAEYNDFVMKSEMDATEYKVSQVWARAQAEMAGFKGNLTQREAYNNAVMQLAYAEEQGIRDAADRAAAASDDAMKRSINAASSALNAWYTALEVINGEVVNATVGHGPTAPGTTPIDRGQTVGGLSGVHPGGSIGAVSGATVLGNTDPRVIGLMGQGYTAGEAAAIVGGYGGMISIPVGQRQTALAQAGGLGNVAININGTVLGSKDEIARVVGDSLTDLLRRQGYTLPGR